MGSLQKKKIEVPHKLMKKESHYSSLATLRRSHSETMQSNGTQNGLGMTEKGCSKISKAIGSDRLMELSFSDSEQDQKGPSDGRETDLNASNASPTVVSESGLISDEEKPFLLGNMKKQELMLANLTISGPISYMSLSGNSNLMNILNYFPQKGPVFSSRKKLLILDINGILADIVYPPPKGYKADTKIAGRAVYIRPFCSDFLNFCLERFNVAIWSSRSRKIIDRLINYLIGDVKHKLIFCWDLSHCTESNFRTLENKHKAVVFKELKKVWEGYDPDLPWEKGHFNETNTVLLDDTPYKALLNPPHTAVFPYSYDFKDQDDSAIGPKGNIRAYLEEVAVAEDVQKYIEQHPFGQSAITETSLSWRFYHKVIKVHTDTTTAVPASGG